MLVKWAIVEAVLFSPATSITFSCLLASQTLRLLMGAGVIRYYLDTPQT